MEDSEEFDSTLITALGFEESRTLRGGGIEMLTAEDLSSSMGLASTDFAETSKEPESGPGFLGGGGSISVVIVTTLRKQAAFVRSLNTRRRVSSLFNGVLRGYRCEIAARPC